MENGARLEIDTREVLFPVTVLTPGFCELERALILALKVQLHGLIVDFDDDKKTGCDSSTTDVGRGERIRDGRDSLAPEAPPAAAEAAQGVGTIVRPSQLGQAATGGERPGFGLVRVRVTLGGWRSTRDLLSQG